MSWKLYIDLNKCDGCRGLHKGWADAINKYMYDDHDKGECVLVCPVDVFEMKDSKAKAIDEIWCIGCQSCLDVCPTYAIELDYLDE